MENSRYWQANSSLSGQETQNSTSCLKLSTSEFSPEQLNTSCTLLEHRIQSVIFFHLHLDLPSGFFSSGLRLSLCSCFSNLRLSYMFRQVHPPYCCHFNDIRWRARIMKFLVKLWTFRRQMAFFFFYGGSDKLGGNIRLAVVAVLSRRSDVDLSQEQVAIFTLTNLGETDNKRGMALSLPCVTVRPCGYQPDLT
jgi:hypothetical protein